MVKFSQCVYVLADHGSNLEATNKDGNTALHIMVLMNRLDCVMALLSKGANGAAVASDGNNALHMSVKVSRFNSNMPFFLCLITSFVFRNYQLRQCNASDNRAFIFDKSLCT